MNAVDTNILIYAQDPRDKSKQKIAQQLIAALDDGVLLWQVACEYLSNARKLQSFGFSYADSLKVIQDLSLGWQPILPSWSIHAKSLRLIQKYSLSFWDAMLIAACLENRVACIYSEDLGDMSYGMIENLKLVNPFRD